MTYSERLVASWPWWVMTAVMTASVWLAFHAAVGGAGAWFVTLAVVVVLVVALGNWSAATIRVDGGRLQAGPARIETRYLSEVDVLDPDATRELRGVRADARAWLLLRPWIRTSVRVGIRDADDPHPYWLLSSRHPDRLAEALRREIVGTHTAAAVPDSPGAPTAPSLDRDTPRTGEE